LICWRISNYVDLSGIGGLRASGRWHNAGKPIIYTADTPSSALLEVLVHLEIYSVDNLPDAYTLARIEVPDDLLGDLVEESSLQASWREELNVTRDIGDKWLNKEETAVLAVPSAIVPYTTHYLIQN
jgi:RES domain-containing protein